MTDLRERVVPEVRPVPARLPWHLRKAFLLPVLAALLVGTLASVTLLAAATYTYVRLHQAIGQLQSELSSSSTSTEDSANVPTAGVEAQPADDSTAAAADEDATDPAATVRYVVTGDAGDTQARWIYDANGTVQSDDTLGSSFTLTMDGSQAWLEHSITVSSPSGRGDLACKVVGADGEVLAQDRASGRAPSVTCSSRS